MPFVTGLFVLSFCFVFYVIWHQFLRKDARLSVGIKVLQKKMNMLETLSHQTDVQLNKGITLLDKKNKDLEKIVSEARFCIFKMEKLLSGFEEKNSQFFKKNQNSSSQKISLVSDSEKNSQKESEKNLQSNSQKNFQHASDLQQTSEKNSSGIKKIALVKKVKFNFGESPFSRIKEEKEDKSSQKESYFPTLDP